MHISPSNISQITLALFYVTSQEVRKKYSSDALVLMDKLTEAWYHCDAETTKPSKTKIKKLMKAAKAVISILKPASKQRIENQAV